MIKLDSIWYHEAPGNGKLASSHIALMFCALAKDHMIVNDLLEMQFLDIPNDIADRSVSPMDYFLAYTDGELRDTYVKPKYRKKFTELYDGDKIYDTIFNLDGMEHDTKNKTYTLKCTWHNVDILADWLRWQFDS